MNYKAASRFIVASFYFVTFCINGWAQTPPKRQLVIVNATQSLQADVNRLIEKISIVEKLSQPANRLKLKAVLFSASVMVLEKRVKDATPGEMVEWVSDFNLGYYEALRQELERPNYILCNPTCEALSDYLIPIEKNLHTIVGAYVGTKRSALHDKAAAKLGVLAGFHKRPLPKKRAIKVNPK